MVAALRKPNPERHCQTFFDGSVFFRKWSVYAAALSYVPEIQSRGDSPMKYPFD